MEVMRHYGVGRCIRQQGEVVSVAVGMACVTMFPCSCGASGAHFVRMEGFCGLTMCGMRLWKLFVVMRARGMVVKCMYKQKSGCLDEPQIAPVTVGAPVREESAGGNDAPRRVGVSQVPRALSIRGESRVG